MNHEDTPPQVALDKQAASLSRQDRDALADRAADAATDLYATEEHQERQRRFELALTRASGAQ